MTPNKYVKLTARTDHESYQQACMPRVDADLVQLCHYVLGLGTEVAEVQDIVKKYLAYGKEVDYTHFKEELGDVLWYMARICDMYGFTFEQLMDMNIKKLKARYSDKFTEKEAINRDLNNEQAAIATKE